MPPQIAEPNQPIPVSFQPQIFSTPPQVPLPLEMPNVAGQAPVGPSPVVKEVRNYTMQYPAGSPWSTLPATEVPGKQIKLPTYQDYSCAELLAQIAAQKPTEFSVEVVRHAPAVSLDGAPLKLGTVWALNSVMAFPFIRNSIEQLHGGGDYGLRVLNSVGKQVHALNFSIEGEPILTETDMRVAPRHHGRPRTGPMGVVMGESLLGSVRRGSSYLDMPLDEKDQALVDAKKQELIEMQSTATTRARLHRLDAERELSKSANKEQDEVIRKQADEKDRQERRDQGIREAELKKEEREHSTLEKILLAIMAKPPEIPRQTGPDMAVMMKPIELVLQQQMSILQALMNKPAEKPAFDMAAVMNMSNAANEKLVQMALENATSASSRHEKLLDTLLTRKIEDGDQSNKLLQTIELIDRIRDGDRDGDEWHNPEAGFLTNLGNGLLSGIKGLLANPNTVSMAMQLLNSKLNKPVGNTQFTDADLTPIAQEMERLKMTQGAPVALPPPQGRLALPTQAAPRQMAPQAGAQAARPRVPAAMPIDDPLYEVSPDMPRAAVPVAAPAPLPVISQAAAPAEPLVATPGPVSPSLQPQEQEPPEVGDPMVNEAMEIMLDDVEAGRRDHEWWSFAFEKWSKPLLDELCRAADEAARWQILQREADPVLFNELSSKLLAPVGQEQYQWWSRAMTSLLQQHAGNAAHAAA